MASLPHGSRALGVAIAIVIAGCGEPEADAPSEQARPLEAAPAYVGRAACAGCHPDEVAAFADSHHDLAMAPVDASSLRGAFDDARFADASGAVRFLRDGGAFRVEAPGRDGAPAVREVAWAFGVEPLQQLLLPAPGASRPSAWRGTRDRPRRAAGAGSRSSRTPRRADRSTGRATSRPRTTSASSATPRATRRATTRRVKPTPARGTRRTSPARRVTDRRRDTWSGRAGEGLAVLADASAQRPGDRSLLLALATLHRDRGEREAAITWARRLVETAPGDPRAAQLRDSLER